MAGRRDEAGPHGPPSDGVGAAVGFVRAARSRPWLVWVPVALDAALIFGLSSRPRITDDLPGGSVLAAAIDPIPGGDKIPHFLSFFLFGLLLLVAIDRTRPPAGPGAMQENALLAFVVALAYGATDEIHQHFVPPRTPEVGDLLADALGAAAAILSLTLIRNRRRRRVHAG